MNTIISHLLAGYAGMCIGAALAMLLMLPKKKRTPKPPARRIERDEESVLHDALLRSGRMVSSSRKHPKLDVVTKQALAEVFWMRANRDE